MKKKKKKNKPQGKNIMSASATQCGHNEKKTLRLSGNSMKLTIHKETTIRNNNATSQ